MAPNFLRAEANVLAESELTGIETLLSAGVSRCSQVPSLKTLPVKLYTAICFDVCMYNLINLCFLLNFSKIEVISVLPNSGVSI